MSINFKFEVPILWLFQVQIIIDISIRVVYNGRVKHIFTLCHSRQINVATWFLVFPIDIENKSTIENINIYQYIYAYFAIPPAENSGISKSTGWAIIEELSIRRRVRTFLVSWGQTTRVKNCYVDLSSSYEFWFPTISIDMNVIFYRNPPILETFRLPVCVTDLLRCASRVSPASCQHVGAWVDSACMSVHDSFVIDGQNSNRI